MYIPTHWPTVSWMLHPINTMWNPSKEDLGKALDKHKKEYKYKRFCRTHGVAFIIEYNKEWRK